MSRSVSFRKFFKTTGLALTALVFLGSIEFSTSSGSGDGKTAIRATHINQLPMVTDDILGESEEERDIEARAAIFLLTEIIHLPEQIPDRGYLLPDPVTQLASLSENSANPRGPPTI